MVDEILSRNTVQKTELKSALEAAEKPVQMAAARMANNPLGNAVIAAGLIVGGVAATPELVSAQGNVRLGIADSSAESARAEREIASTKRSMKVISRKTIYSDFKNFSSDEERARLTAQYTFRGAVGYFLENQKDQVQLDSELKGFFGAALPELRKALRLNNPRITRQSLYLLRFFSMEKFEGKKVADFRKIVRDAIGGDAVSDWVKALTALINDAKTDNDSLVEAFQALGFFSELSPEVAVKIKQMAQDPKIGGDVRGRLILFISSTPDFYTYELAVDVLAEVIQNPANRENFLLDSAVGYVIPLAEKAAGEKDKVDAVNKAKWDNLSKALKNIRTSDSSLRKNIADALVAILKISAARFAKNQILEKFIDQIAQLSQKEKKDPNALYIYGVGSASEQPVVYISGSYSVVSDTLGRATWEIEFRNPGEDYHAWIKRIQATKRTNGDLSDSQIFLGAYGHDIPVVRYVTEYLNKEGADLGSSKPVVDYLVEKELIRQTSSGRYETTSKGQNAVIIAVPNNLDAADTNQNSIYGRDKKFVRETIVHEIGHAVHLALAGKTDIDQKISRWETDNPAASGAIAQVFDVIQYDKSVHRQELAAYAFAPEVFAEDLVRNGLTLKFLNISDAETGDQLANKKILEKLLSLKIVGLNDAKDGFIVPDNSPLLQVQNIMTDGLSRMAGLEVVSEKMVKLKAGVPASSADARLTAPAPAGSRMAATKEVPIESLAQVFGKPNGQLLSRLDQLTPEDQPVLRMFVAAARLALKDERYSLDFHSGYAVLHATQNHTVVFYGDNDKKIGEVTLTDTEVEQGRSELAAHRQAFQKTASLSDIQVPGVVLAANQTVRVFKSMKDGEPVLLNIVTQDVFPDGLSGPIKTMLTAAVPTLEQHHIFMQFGSIQGSQFVAEERQPLDLARAPENALQSFVASRKSFETLAVPQEAGVALVQKNQGHVIRLLDTFIKTADIRRTTEVSRIKQLISTLADPLKVYSVKPETFGILHQIPSDFNQQALKESYLQELDPLAVLTLEFTAEQLIAYAHLVETAVGAAA